MTAGQLSLFAESQITTKPLKHAAFSHDAACPQIERLSLEATYGGLLKETDDFNRQLVSFQANKTETLR